MNRELRHPCPFRDLDSSEDENSESVYAYFAFVREDD